MAEPAIINSKFVKKTVLVDGNTWEYVEPGVGATSRLSQHFKRLKLFSGRVELLEPKIDNGTATEDELNKYEEYLDQVAEHQQGVMDIFSQVYRDGTKENEGVLGWLDKTPAWKVEKAFGEIAKKDSQSNGKQEAENKEPTR